MGLFSVVVAGWLWRRSFRWTSLVTPPSIGQTCPPCTGAFDTAAPAYSNLARDLFTSSIQPTYPKKHRHFTLCIWPFWGVSRKYTQDTFFSAWDTGGPLGADDQNYTQDTFFGFCAAEPSFGALNYTHRIQNSQLGEGQIIHAGYKFAGSASEYTHRIQIDIPAYAEDTHRTQILSRLTNQYPEAPGM